MSITGNELNLDDEYLMKMKDGTYFYLGKLKDRKKSYNSILKEYSVNYNIFIFENMPPSNLVIQMCLWHYYPLFKYARTNNLDDREIL